MDTSLRLILVGGTSGIGKSTIALHIARGLGWDCVSTDGLAKHPGRPWAVGPTPVPKHVVEHYGTLDAGALTEAQLAHYQTMWPIVEAVVRRHLDPSTQPVVLEGSGIWPDNAAALHLENVAAIWLTGSASLIEARIRRESNYADAHPADRRLIDQFIARSQGYDRRMMERVHALGLPWIEVRPETGLEELAEACRSGIRALA